MQWGTRLRGRSDEKRRSRAVVAVQIGTATGPAEVPPPSRPAMSLARKPRHFCAVADVDSCNHIWSRNGSSA